MTQKKMLNPIEWVVPESVNNPAHAGHLRLLDQTKLPNEQTYLECVDVEMVWQAIKRLSVRGAPAIGISAAYGCVIGAVAGDFEGAADYLATSRPTAVNLFWAIDRMKKVEPREPGALLAEAIRIHEEDRAMCRKIGEHGLALIEKLAEENGGNGEGRDGRMGEERGGGRGVLTHCNAGSLATGGIGTATAPMYVAHEKGIGFSVYADETRPLLQGSRLTAFELAAAGIDVTLICDDMAAQVMREGKIGMVITGADRIAANGDAANKIGTYNLAVLAKHHGLPFYVAAPSSTFDMTLADGSRIPIEERAAEEITEGFGKRTAPPQAMGVKTYSPAFDVTPAELITGIITEHGVIRPVNGAQILANLNGLKLDVG